MRSAGLGSSPTKLAHRFNLQYWGRSITVTTASNWMWGKSLPHLDKLVVLAEILETSLDALLR